MGRMKRKRYLAKPEHLRAPGPSYPNTLLDYPPTSNRIEGPYGWYTTPWKGKEKQAYIRSIGGGLSSDEGE